MNEWISNEIEKIAKFSQSKKGIMRLTLSPEAAKARQYVASLMTDAGLSVRIDQVGNVIGRMDTKENSERPTVLTGSHLDSMGSGKYQGILGIISALAAVKLLKAKGPLSYPVEVIAFAGEDPGSFSISLFGSKIAAGTLGTRTLAQAKDSLGNSLADTLSSQGFDVKNVKLAQLSAARCKAFLELYIEQGQTLEKAGSRIGIARSITGTTKCKITVSGLAAHAGWTPMDVRQDGLISAAMIILAVQEIAQESEQGVLATVSDLKISPGRMNAVPGAVEMWVDIFCTEQTGIIETLQELKDAISVIAEDKETSVSMEIFSSEKPVKLSPVVQAVVEKACKANQLDYCYIDSGSRQDAASMSAITPSGILFIPYDQQEDYVAPADIETGLAVLTEALYQLAK